MTMEHRQAVTPRLPSIEQEGPMDSHETRWEYDPLVAGVWVAGMVGFALMVVGIVTVVRWVLAIVRGL